MKRIPIFIFLCLSLTGMAGTLYVRAKVPAVQVAPGLWQVTCPNCGKVTPPEPPLRTGANGGITPDKKQKVYNAWLEQACHNCGAVVCSVWTRYAPNAGPVWK